MNMNFARSRENRKRNVKQKGARCIRGLVSCQTRRKCLFEKKKNEAQKYKISFLRKIQ